MQNDEMMINLSTLLTLNFRVKIKLEFKKHLNLRKMAYYNITTTEFSLLLAPLYPS